MTAQPCLYALALFIVSCGHKEDVTATINHSGSIETAISVQHADSAHDVVLTTHKIWVNDTLFNTVTHRDTIPGLGSLSTEAADNNGDNHPVTVPKDYEIFITMK